MPSWLLTGVIVAAVVAVVVRRFVGEPLNARDLAVPPLVLMGIGVYSVTKVEQLTGPDIGWVVAGSILGLALGAVRGTTVRLFVRSGTLWQRYTIWTVVVWVVSLAAGAGLGYLATRAGVPEQARPVTLSIGVSLLGELVTLGRRALATGMPFGGRA